MADIDVVRAKLEKAQAKMTKEWDENKAVVLELQKQYDMLLAEEEAERIAAGLTDEAAAALAQKISARAIKSSERMGVPGTG